MLRPDLRAIIAGLLTCCASFTAHSAGEITGESTNQSPVKIIIRSGEIVGGQPVRRAFIYAGTNEFLITLEGLLPNITGTSKLVMAPADHRYQLYFELNTQDDLGLSLDADSCRSVLFRQFPGCEIREQGSCQAARHDGVLFDLRWKTAGAIESFVQSGFVPSPAGLLQFTVVADAKASKEAEQALRLIMRGFQSNERGKIVILPANGDS